MCQLNVTFYLQAAYEGIFLNKVVPSLQEILVPIANIILFFKIPIHNFEKD